MLPRWVRRLEWRVQESCPENTSSLKSLSIWMRSWIAFWESDSLEEPEERENQSREPSRGGWEGGCSCAVVALLVWCVRCGAGVFGSWAGVVCGVVWCVVWQLGGFTWEWIERVGWVRRILGRWLKSDRMDSSISGDTGSTEGWLRGLLVRHFVV